MQETKQKFIVKTYKTIMQKNFTYQTGAKHAIVKERNDIERQIRGKTIAINKVPRAPFTK